MTNYINVNKVVLTLKEGFFLVFCSAAGCIALKKSQPIYIYIYIYMGCDYVCFIYIYIYVIQMFSFFSRHYTFFYCTLLYLNRACVNVRL